MNLRRSTSAALLAVLLALPASASPDPTGAAPPPRPAAPLAGPRITNAPAPAPAAPSVTAPSGPPGKVEVPEMTYDAGKVDRGTVVEHTFLLKNVGKGELSVQARPG